MTAQKKNRFTFPQLALFDWLFENDRKRLFVQHSHSSGGSSSHYFEVAGADESGRKKLSRVFPSRSSSSDAREADVAFLRRLGGRETVDIVLACRSKFLSSYNVNHTAKDVWTRFAAQFANDFQWYDQVYVPTQAARDYWAAEGRQAFEEMKAKREQEAAAVERWVVVGARSRFSPRIPAALASKVPRGMALPLPSREALRPQALCKVVKESETRLYVDDVIPLVEVDYRAQVVTGRPPNRFVSRSDVILDHADEAVARRLADIDAENVEDVNRIAAQAVEEMLPLLLRLNDRLLQKDAEREDAMREILDGRGSAPKPG